MYANLTDEQKSEIIKRFYAALDMGASDVGHATVIAAKDVLVPSIRAWNGKTGSNAYAAALAVLVQEGVVRVEVTDNRFGLSERVKTLMFRAIRTMGSYDPDEILVYIEEELCLDELQALKGFLGWIHRKKLGVGKGNLDERWAEYKRSAS